MPTYQYACTNSECGNEFELVQSFTDPAASECPICGQPVRKRFGSIGVVFKGSGFYRTDSRAEAKSASNGSAKTEKADKGNAKGDTPAAKSESAGATGSGSSGSDSKAPAASGGGSTGRIAASA
jgi:putative FmdB family regulatory protein